jgi:hypothetical protein
MGVRFTTEPVSLFWSKSGPSEDDDTPYWITARKSASPK